MLGWDNWNRIENGGRWYHFGIAPKYEEAFPYSSTLLVWLTDGEHLFQFLKDLCLAIAIGIACQSFYGFVAATVAIYTTGFFKEVLASIFKKQVE